MQLAAERVADERWTMIPVRVLLFDPARQCVDTQPVVSIKGPDGLVRPMPPIPCAPVAFPAWGTYSVRAPVLPGDLGYLLVSSVSMAQWLITGVDGAIPEAPRRQSLSDVIYVGGLHSFTAPPTPTTGLVVGSSVAYVQVTDPTVVLVEAPSIQLGLTATDPLTKWPPLATMLSQIQADIAALATTLALAAPAVGVQAGPGVPPLPAVTPTFTSVDPTTPTVKVTGE